MPDLSWTQWLAVVGVGAFAAFGIVTFLLFWFRQEKTAVTFLLLFSTIRHGFRLKHEIKTGKIQQAQRPPVRAPAALKGTLSGYMLDARRDATARLTRELERIDHE